MAAVDQLLDLLPRGLAWARRAGSGMRKVLNAIAAEFDRVEARAEDALRESLPITATELLEDYVELFGLEGLGALDPDGPLGPLQVAQRAVHAHITSTKLSQARLRELCKIIGLTGPHVELVSREVTAVDEATLTMGGTSSSELEAFAEKEKHATGTLVWVWRDFVASEIDGVTTIAHEASDDSAVQEAA